MPNPRHQLGQRGELRAAAWLSARAWTVLERGWRGEGGELDLVCREPGGVLVGVEVKVRSTGRAGSAAESLDRRRVGRLRRTLAGYAAEHGVPGSGLRIDLVTLTREGQAWRLVHHAAVDQW
jgi:putative endonuclease